MFARALIGVRADGTKQLVALADGYHESPADKPDIQHWEPAGGRTGPDPVSAGRVSRTLKEGSGVV